MLKPTWRVSAVVTNDDMGANNVLQTGIMCGVALARHEDKTLVTLETQWSGQPDK